MMKTKHSAKKIHKHPAYRWVPGIFNFFVWGLGYLADKRITLGLLWLAVFFAVTFAINTAGIAWYLTTTPGNLFLVAHLAISYILFIDGIGGKGSKKY
jgi:hypothetical protein